jgi:hypothetical protein
MLQNLIANHLVQKNVDGESYADSDAKSHVLTKGVCSVKKLFY